MPKVLRGGLRLAAVAAVVAMLAPVGSLLFSATGGSRDFARCVQTCNDIRRNCDSRCISECTTMFPNDATARNACISACQTVCDVSSKDCKITCKDTFKGDSPTAP